MKKWNLERIIQEVINFCYNKDIYMKRNIMKKNIKNILEDKMNKLYETKGFEDMTVAFGVREKSDNLDAEEAAQFGSLETVKDMDVKDGVKLGEPSVQPALNKVHKEDKKDEDQYFTNLAKKMKDFQETSESDPTQIGESFESPMVTREDDELEPEDVYSTEALGTGMQALKYDNEGTEVHKKLEDRMDDLNDGDATYEKLKKYSEKYLKHKYSEPDEYHYTPKVRTTEKAVQSEGYSDIDEKNIFKVKGTIKNKEQVISLVDRLPYRVRVDETVFSVTDGDNSYRLVWEGSEDGEAIVTHEKNINIVTESIDKMKHLWEYKASNPISTKKNIAEGSDDVFFKMMNKVRSKETLNEEVAVDAKANKSTIKKLAKELSNDSDLGAKCRQLIKKDGDCSQELKDMAKENSNDSDLGAACRKMCELKESLHESVHDSNPPVPGKSKPRFGRMELKFDSEVDKALYIVLNPKLKSKAEPEFLEWASSLGYTQEEMESEGKKIKDYIKKEVKENPEFPGWGGGAWTQMTGEIIIPKMASEPN